MNNLFIEETLPDYSYRVLWRGENGISDIEIALEFLKNCNSTNRLELWSKAHAETEKGFAPMAFKENGIVKISNLLKILLGF